MIFLIQINHCPCVFVLSTQSLSTKTKQFVSFWLYVTLNQIQFKNILLIWQCQHLLLFQIIQLMLATDLCFFKLNLIYKVRMGQKLPVRHDL